MATRFFFGVGTGLVSATFCSASLLSSSAACESTNRCPITNTFRNFRLGEVINLATDVAVFRFLLPQITDEFWLLPCSTLMATWHSQGGVGAVDRVERFYTPITRNGTRGYFDLIVKKQPNGRMTERLFSLAPGDSLMFRSVQCKLKYASNTWHDIALIGGGTGLTPLLQVMRCVLDNPDDRTRLTLIFANRSPEKILLKGLIDQMQQTHPTRLRVIYVCDHVDEGHRLNADPDSCLLQGRINGALLQKYLPPPSNKTKILVCGPDRLLQSLCGTPPSMTKAWSGSLPRQPSVVGMMNNIPLDGTLAALGYKTEEVFRF